MLQAFAIAYMILTSFATAAPFYSLGLEAFILLNLIYILSGSYFSYYSFETLSNSISFVFKKCFSWQYFKKNWYKYLMFLFGLLLFVVPMVMLFTNSVVYMYMFFVETSILTPEICLPLMLMIFVPVTFVALLNGLKDLFSFLNSFVESVKNINIASIVILLLSMPLAAYLSIAILKLNIIGFQLFQVTITDSNVVYPVNTFLQVLMFIPAFIMTTSVLCKILSYLYKLIFTKEYSKKSDMGFSETIFASFCAVAQATLNIASGSFKTGRFTPTPGAITAAIGITCDMTSRLRPKKK